jgi:hypothetical protein
MKLFKLKIYDGSKPVKEYWMPSKSICMKIFKEEIAKSSEPECMNFTIQEENIPSDSGGMCFWLNNYFSAGIIDSNPRAPAPAAAPVPSNA